MTSEVVRKIIKRIANNEVKFNVCHLSRLGYFLGSKTLKEKNSASPTVIVFGKLIINSLKPENDVDVSLKIFPERNSRYHASLLYEVEVYRYVIEEILSKQYSPNFVPYLGFSRCLPTQTSRLLQNRFV